MHFKQAQLAIFGDMKPPETTPKPLETTQKLLKPLETSHIIVLFLLKMTYSQVVFVLILHPKVFFGQTWSQKLKLSKMIDTGVHCYILIRNLMFPTLVFIFLKFCDSYDFWQIWSQNLMFSKLTKT